MEIAKLFNALPSAGSQGVIWGIMAIGVYITYRILDVADLTVDGSIATGGAVAAVLIIGGCNVWVAMVAAFLVGMLAGLATGIFHTFMGIPAILAGILTQLSLYSINLRILGGKLFGNREICAVCKYLTVCEIRCQNCIWHAGHSNCGTHYNRCYFFHKFFVCHVFLLF